MTQTPELKACALEQLRNGNRNAWLAVGQAGGRLGIRWSTNARLVEFLTEIIAPLEADNAALKAKNEALVEALGEARQIIASVEAYMARPERGDWGVECALCMGELFDDDRAAIGRIDEALTGAQ